MACLIYVYICHEYNAFSHLSILSREITDMVRDIAKTLMIVSFFLSFSDFLN